MHPMIYGEWGRRDYVAALGAVVLGRANVGRSVDSIVAFSRQLSKRNDISGQSGAIRHLVCVEGGFPKPSREKRGHLSGIHLR